VKGLTNYGLLAIALIVGILVGYAGTALFGSPGAGKVRNARLEVGDRAPDFRLPDHTGGFVQLSDFQGQRNVVIAFYPLAWTPV
jgi:cytochrome oxidase Cu insertion factor (SCO1/SenC/PrrC family)